MSAPDPSHDLAIAALAPTPLARVERAAGELRRGLAVIVADEAGEAQFVVAAELANEAKIVALKALAGADPDLALTENRAATLKIRRYTEDVVRVPYPRWLTADLLQSLADPARDLDYPMRGPFAARRDPVPRAVAAAVQLAKIASLLPAVLVAPARPSGADLVTVSVADILDYEIAAASRLRQVTAARVPLADAENARLIAFRAQDGGREHLAIVIGEPARPGPVLVRLHSECFTGDLIGSLKCDCGDQLRGAIREIGRHGAGILLYLRQEGRGIGLTNKLRAYALQDQGFDTVEANERLGFEPDERVFLAAAEMLRQLGYREIRLMTNNPEKIDALEALGITVVERVPHAFPANEHNADYLRTKAKKSGHLL